MHVEKSGTCLSLSSLTALIFLGCSEASCSPVSCGTFFPLVLFRHKVGSVTGSGSLGVAEMKYIWLLERSLF